MSLNLNDKIAKILAEYSTKVPTKAELRRIAFFMKDNNPVSGWVRAARGGEFDTLLAILGVKLITFKRYFSSAQESKMSPLVAIRVEIAANMVREMRGVGDRWKLPRLSRYKLCPAVCGQCELAAKHDKRLAHLDAEDAASVEATMSELMESQMDELAYLQDLQIRNRIRNDVDVRKSRFKILQRVAAKRR